ncbi:hypothetical protein PVAP13_6KG398233 [Panicum virgatum]|uniref:Uncharacterized protein n=1 Tax=Panicum virgatum TaxID=38727 RepID=A0A8T0RHQ8_PANVG|nr:hypothetical protein PVAP13_6KG398233 [Panicum virgatum]
MVSPARKRLSESVEEVAGDGGEMIGVSNTKRAKVAVADGGMGSGSIIGRGAQQRLHRHQARQHHHQAPEGQAGGDPEGDEDCEKKTILLSRKLKHLFENRPTTANLKFSNERLTASLQKMINFEQGVLKQFETKGYALYEMDMEVAEDEDEDPLCGDG